MTIEVRQIVIRSTVVEDGGRDPDRAPAGRLAAEERERIKAEVIAECREWLAERLRESRER